MLKQRQQSIREKGFNLVSSEGDLYPSQDYSSMRIGLKTMDNVLVNLGTYRKINPNFGSKQYVLSAIYRHDQKALVELSNYYYESSGIYYRLCRYLATLYRFDWYITPYAIDISKENESKLMRDFSKALLYLDKSDTKRVCGNMALDIIKEGAFYGILVDFGDRFAVQKLPVTYCRTRYFSGPDPIVELNLQFFDAYFSNPQYKIKVLKTFPQDIQRAYVLYKEGKLKGDYPGDLTCWVPLDPGVAFKLSLNNSDFPALVNVIPSIIDLDQAQELDRQKTMQQLLKIIVQKLPLDKNGDLVFDVDEARDIHNNAVTMLKRAIGVDVLTTFADIEKIDTKDTNSSLTTDDLEKVERTVYNNSGISQNLFNADGNLAVTNSILADEASMRDIPLIFTSFLNRVTNKFSRPNHYDFRVSVLETTQFNYREIAKLYKEQAQTGGPKLLPEIALGHSQSNILATLTFENEVLHLAEVMIPPMSSNTMSATVLGNSNSSTQQKTQSNQTEEKETGRPEKEDNEKSDKTIANQESQS